jgi:CheY-like chemotaxis protein
VVIVAVTAFSMPNDRQKVMTAGFDGYLSKPIEPENFVAQIEAFLPAELRSPRPAQRP